MKRFIITAIALILACLVHPCFSQNQQQISPFKLLSSGHNFPEGPAWNGNNTLYVSNCYGSYISRITGTQTDTFVSAWSSKGIIEKTNGLTVFRDGSVYACEYGKGKIVKFTPAGETVIISSGYNGRKFNRPNDLAFDAKGNLYFTDPNSYDPNKLDGMIYKIKYGSSIAEPVDSLLGFPNGIAFSADARFAYVCESALHRILKYKVDRNGSFSGRQVFAELPGGDPDGVAVDKKGNIYVAHFGGGGVYVFSPEGKILRKITAPGKKPSNIEFGGRNMKTLFLTEDETNSVYSMENEIPGSPLLSAPKPVSADKSGSANR